MDIKYFFNFSDGHLASSIQVESTNLNIKENDLDDHWKLIKGDYKGIYFPIIFKQRYGKNFNDILGTGWPGLYLISERFKNVLEENNLKGWTTFHIKLYNKKGDEIMGYHGFSVLGKCGPTSYSNCEIIEKRLVPNGPLCKYYKGVCIDGWDGSDFFTPERSYETFITQKAADKLRKHKISNMSLENLADVEMAVENIL
jgi:hypothetical protein